MNIVKTAKCKILNYTSIFDDTVSIYRSALSFYIDICYKEWDYISNLKSKYRNNYIERITHKTSKSPDIKYDFDSSFYKFPSYLRRAAIAEAIGYVSSFKSQLENYNESDKKAKQPTLNLHPNSYPVLYDKGNWIKLSDGKARIKIYRNNDWVWLDINYDIKPLYSSKKYRFAGDEELSPAIRKYGKKYFLNISFKNKVKLTDNKDIACSVDLGINTSATCSIITSDGTVVARLFINQASEKDRLNSLLGKLSKATRNSGIKNSKPNLWRKINNVKKHIAIDTMNKIIAFAQTNNATVIVFEHLGKMKVPKGFYGARRLRFKLQYWTKQFIYHKTLEKAHSLGLRVSRVSPKNTSRLAYDGSGLVSRGEIDPTKLYKHKPSKNYSICKFTTGKIYNADLSASYNIGARYFIREIIKPLSEKTRLQLEAKVPLLAARNQHTLSTLISLKAAC
jgi:transposase, IS605 orfB family